MEAEIQQASQKDNPGLPTNETNISPAPTKTNDTQNSSLRRAVASNIANRNCPIQTNTDSISSQIDPRNGLNSQTNNNRNVDLRRSNQMPSAKRTDKKKRNRN